MFNNEEKGSFINSIFDQIPEASTTTKAIQIIKPFLLKNTNNGKLYKFRSFNDNSLCDLLNGTLYCSLPSSFNDPFDCQVGIDFQSYFLAKYEEVLKPIDTYLGRFIQLYDGVIKPRDCNDKEKAIFVQWQNNNGLIDFLKKYRGANVDETQIGQLLCDNFQIVIDIMLPFLSDDDLKSQMHAALSLMPNMINCMTPEGKIAITKSDATYEDFAKSLGIDADADEISLTGLIYASQRPEDSALSKKLDEEFNKINKNLAQSIDNMFRVGCLCTDYKNRLMWSHYADGHKGFCVEYDFECDNKTLSDILILPVVYSNQRPKFPWAVAIANDKSSDIVKKEGAKRMLQSLLTKDEAWSYEDEWRIIMLCSTGKDKVEMPPVSCIYVGALCSDKDKMKIEEIAKKLNVKTKQMTVDRGEYKLHATDC